MGQQQLLLLVLGIVIVGLAVVSGIQSFDENNRKFRRESAIVASMEYGSAIQGWLDKPSALGGGDGIVGSFKLENLGYEADGTCTLNGRQYVRLPDDSQLALGSDGGNPFIAWFPNGDCESSWSGSWEFHLIISPEHEVDFVPCGTVTSYGWSQQACPAW